MLRLPPQNIAHRNITLQPFNAICNHSFKIPHRTTHTGTTTRCKTHRRIQLRDTTLRPQPHPPHRRGTFHRRLQPLYTEKLQGFVLHGFTPQNIAHATFMQPFQLRSATTASRTALELRTTGTTTRCKTHRRNNYATETTPAAPAATDEVQLSSPAAATLHAKLHYRFRAPASLPQT